MCGRAGGALAVCVLSLNIFKNEFLYILDSFPFLFFLFSLRACVRARDDGYTLVYHLTGGRRSGGLRAATQIF